MRKVVGGDLRQIALFAGLSDDCCAALVDSAQLESCGYGTALFEEGERPRFLHILVEGEVELFAQLNERETNISVLHPINTLNLAAAIGGVPHLTSGRARQKSVLITISVDAVRRAFDHDIGFARSVANELSHGFCELIENLRNQKLLTSSERLASWLLRADGQSGGSGQFSLPFGKRLLASQLGMTPENLSRSLKFLAGHGAEISGRRVNLVDRDALTAIADATLEPRERRVRVPGHPADVVMR
jgi:CRP/FNR family transcriptional activator FtrB